MQLYYLGPEGTFSHAAAMAFARLYRLGDVSYVPLPSVATVLTRVAESGEDPVLGCVPVENSIEGSVTTSWDTIGSLLTAEQERTPTNPKDHLSGDHAQRRHRILATGRLTILQNLLTAHEFSDLTQIRDVYSHPQALAQCRQWLLLNLPHAHIYPMESTALAAQRIQTEQREDAAAIASVAAASHYRLHIQVEGIQDKQHNVTRFALFGDGKGFPPPVTDSHQNLSLLLRGVANAPGGLYATLEPFSRLKLNLRRIESRPVGTSLGTYVFYLDVEWGKGPGWAERLRVLERELREKQVDVISLGLYPETDLMLPPGSPT